MAESIKLKSGIEITIKDMSIDEMDSCKDSLEVTFNEGVATGVKNVNRTRTRWLRAGLSHVDTWRAKNGEIPPDEALKMLSDEDKQEAAEAIQEAQVITKKKLPNSNSMS